VVLIGADRNTDKKHGPYAHFLARLVQKYVISDDVLDFDSILSTNPLKNPRYSFQISTTFKTIAQNIPFFSNANQ